MLQIEFLSNVLDLVLQINHSSIIDKLNVNGCNFLCISLCIRIIILSTAKVQFFHFANFRHINKKYIEEI